MARPKTAQDVVALVRRSGLVAELEIGRFTDRLSPEQTPEDTLGLLVATGLLTRYQMDELAAGRWQGLWLGGYKILDRLGQGGMSHVYLAEHAVLGKRVAVKVLSVSLRSDQVARRRFVREARAAAAIDHPNIVHVFDVDVNHDPPYLVMEYTDGVSLQAAVARHGTFTGAEAAVVGVEVARGLAAAADVGLVHRDVKPANLMVDRLGRVKILDLGIVRLRGDETHPRMDGTEEILGTLDYLAPEQAVDSAGVDARADLYSLGATLYFLLAGHPTFPGLNVRQKLAAKQYSDPPPIHRLRPDVDPALSRVIHTLLAREAASRYQTAAETVNALAVFAISPTDFPARLFRPIKPSTLTDEQASVERDPSPLESTQRIRKQSPRPTPPDSTSPSPDPAELGPPTLRLSQVQTDLVMTALPSDVQARYLASRNVPQPPRRYLRLIGWMLLAILLVAGSTIALIHAW